MITQKQVADLATDYKIDRFTIFREYLQLLFLSYLYQQKSSDKIFFKGGTAIRLLFGSSRFSEDLDFSTTYHQQQIKKIIKQLEVLLKKEQVDIKIIPLYFGENTSRFRLYYRSPEFKYPLVVRLDFHQINKIPKIECTPLLTKFPIIIFPIISHLSKKEILAEKICALLTRTKGRDFFDIWYLLEKGINIDQRLIAQKLQLRGEKYNQGNLLKKILAYSQKNLDLDLNQFLPKSQRKIIPMLKKVLIKYFKHQPKSS